MWTESKQSRTEAQSLSRVILAVLAVFVWSGSHATIFAAPEGAPVARRARQDWPVYGGEASGDRYSPLRKINRTNVKQLRMAWKFDVGTEGGLQTNPLIVGRTLFVYTPSQKVVALDGATGKQLWAFDAGIPAPQPNRGFSLLDRRQGEPPICRRNELSLRARSRHRNAAYEFWRWWQD
jgi:glucose dehydrogenase